MRDEFSESVHIPPDTAFQYFQRRDLMVQWLDLESAEYDLMFEDRVTPGAKAVITPHRGGKNWRMTAECAEVVSDKKVVWRFIDGPLRGEETWAVSCTGEGCTVLKSIEYEIDGALRRLAWKLGGRRMHSRSCTGEMEKLRDILEKAEVSASR